MGAALASEAFDQFCGNRLFEGIKPEVLQEIAPEMSVVRLHSETAWREGISRSSA